MKPSNLIRFYLQRLRPRIVQELFAILGIAVGVALLFASQVANTSLSGSVDQLTAGLIGRARLQIEARDPHGFSEAVLHEAQRLPGVLAVAPVVEASGNVAGPVARRSVDLIGIEPSFVGLHGSLLHRFSAAQLARQQALGLPGVLAQEIGSSPLSIVKLDIDGRQTAAPIGIVLREGEIGALAHSPIIIAPLRYAQKLTGMTGRITRVLVQPQPGLDRQVQAELVRLAGGTLNVRPADFDAAVFREAEGPTSQSTELFSVVSALVGFLFAFNAMLLTAPQRRSVVVALRLDGYTPWQVVQVLLFDALALGLMGSLAGLLLGDILAQNLLRASPGYLSLAFPVGSQEIVTWQCVAVAAGGGVLAACIGVMSPLRDVFARRPHVATAARAPALISPAWLLTAGLACLLVTTVVLLAGVESVTVAVIGFVSLVAALLLLLPPLLRVIFSVFDRLQRPIVGAAPHIALMELRSRSAQARSLAIAATGAIAVFGSVAIEGARSNLQDGLNHVDVDVNLVADLWVSPAGSANTLATVPFHGGSDATALARLAGVQSVAVYRGAFLDMGDHRTLVIAPPRTSTDPIPPTQVVAGNLAQATAEVRGHGWATVSRTIADEYHLHVGQPFVLPTPRPTMLRLAAITSNFGWPPGAIVLNAEDYARAWGSQDPSAYQVDLKPGVSLAAGASEVQRALGPQSALAIQTARQREENDRATQHQGLARLNQIATLVLIAAVLAMAAAMGAMIWQRKPRIASMKVDGFSRGELWRALLYESTLLLGAGCSIGALFGLYGQLILSHALVTVTGFPATFSVGAPTALYIFAIVTAIAVAIVAVPGYLAARVRPALQE
jgi:putative ABC transport system permease protein